MDASFFRLKQFYRLLSLLQVLVIAACSGMPKAPGNRTPAHTLRNATGAGGAFQSFSDKIRNYVSQPTDEEIIDELRQIAKSFSAREHTNKFNVKISQYEFPWEIIDDIQAAFDFAAKSKNPAIRETELLRNVVVNGAILLLRGRGSSYDSATQQIVKGTGWYGANSNGTQSGLAEFQKILDQKWLDDEGKQAVKAFLNATDYDSDAFKKSIGFPPQFAIMDATTKANLSQKIDRATARSNFAVLPVEFLEKAPLLEKLLAQSKIPAGQQEFIQKTLPIEKNLYDKSASVINDPNGKFIDYFGREKETQDVVDALTRIKKGHVLLTGKAGVGKTTILEILSDRMVQGKLGIRNELSPIILELPITLLTNNSDPTAIKDAIYAAKLMAKGLNRRVILYVDEAHIMSDLTRNAIKSFLSESLGPEDTLVHMVISTTSGESATFFKDMAFSRRFIEVMIREFHREETIALVKKANVPVWERIQKNKVRAFNGQISDEAMNFAYKYGYLEQPHAGNPTGTLELLEGAIVRKLNNDQTGFKGDFGLEAEDVQEYLRNKYAEALLPDDPDFQKKFEARWAEVDRAFQGNEGFKHEFKKQLRTRLANPHEKKMMASIFFGPPAAGKTYFNELLSRSFYKSKPFTINGGEYKNGGLEVNKLIGSPPGTVNSDELGALIKFIIENPMGGVIKIEEMDYLHQDVIQLITNMITDGEITDAKGKVWRTNGFLLVGNTNIGQDLMINASAAEAMTWEQYQTRKSQLIETVSENGKTYTRVKKKKIEQVFDRLMETIVSKSNSNEDSSLVAQEAQKQKRRYKGHYLMSPDRDELEKAAQYWAEKYAADRALDYGVTFKIPPEVVLDLAELDQYDFVKGHSYVVERLEASLGDVLGDLSRTRGASYSVSLEATGAGRTLVVLDEKSGNATRHALESVGEANKNPWASSPEMLKRIRELPTLMNRRLKSSAPQILGAQSLAKKKTLNWNGTKLNFTLLGTSGNGKTQFAKALAESLYGDSSAIFTITNLNFEGDLNTYIRPRVGYVGGTQETEFERWVKARYESGGGVILLDELLSFDGLTREQIASRLNVFTQLYELLDERRLRIGPKTFDMAAFSVVITGNALQEYFFGVDGGLDMDKQVADIERSLTKDDIAKYLQSKYGFDAAKTARLGEIYVKGPLRRADVPAVGRILITDAIAEVARGLPRKVDFTYDPEIVQRITAEKTTVRLGMRDVNSAFNTVLMNPYANIIFDLPGVTKIEVRMVGATQKLQWFADGKEIYLAGEQFDPEAPMNQVWTYRSESKLPDFTPQLESIMSPKVKLSDLDKEIIAVHEFYGHWVPSVVLQGENTAVSINLNPGEGYGGYVQFKQDESIVRTLVGLSKDAIKSEGGHRAVFLRTNHFASGGGGSLGAKLSERSDDFAHVTRNINAIIANHLLEGLSEHSSEHELRVLRETLHSVYAFAADALIRTEMRKNVFREAYEHTKQKGYVSAEKLDELAREIVPSLGSKDVTFVAALVHGVRKTVRSHAKIGRPVPKALLENFLRRTLEELSSQVSTADRALLAKYVVDGIGSLDFNCKKYLAPK